MITAQKEKQYKRIIISLSVVIPLAVAILFGVKIPGVDLSFLPSIYASINGMFGRMMEIAGTVLTLIPIRLVSGLAAPVQGLSRQHDVGSGAASRWRARGASADGVKRLRRVL